MKQLDPNSNGTIGFDVFVDYMTRELTDMDTSEQLLQSFRTISGDKVRVRRIFMLQSVIRGLIEFLFCFQGYLTEADIRRELPADQADYILSQLKPLKGAAGDNGALDFEHYVLTIYGTK